VYNGLKAFLSRNVKQYDYQHHKVHFIGSIAYYYREVLQEALRDCGMQIGTIVQAPMEGLVEYHK
jgi:hypothetical protein